MERRCVLLCEATAAQGLGTASTGFTRFKRVLSLMRESVVQVLIIHIIQMMGHPPSFSISRCCSVRGGPEASCSQRLECDGADPIEDPERYGRIRKSL